MATRAFLQIFTQVTAQPTLPQPPLLKALAFVTGLGLSMLSYPVHTMTGLSVGPTLAGLTAAQR